MLPPPRQALLRRIQRLNVHTWFGVHRRLDWPRPKSQSLTLSPSVHLRPSRSPSAACSSNPSPWALRGFTCFILTTGCTSTRAKRFRGSKEARREPPRDRSETLLKAAGKEVAFWQHFCHRLPGEPKKLGLRSVCLNTFAVRDVDMTFWTWVFSHTPSYLRRGFRAPTEKFLHPDSPPFPPGPRASRKDRPFMLCQPMPPGSLSKIR